VLNLVPGQSNVLGPAAGSSLIDEIVREGARRMLAAALQAEVDAYVARAIMAVVRALTAVSRAILSSRSDSTEPVAVLGTAVQRPAST